MEKVTNLDLALKQNTIITMNQSTGKTPNSTLPTFYVVTRNGRRAWPKDYWTIGEAQNHATNLIQSLKSFKDPSFKNVVIVETTDPESLK